MSFYRFMFLLLGLGYFSYLLIMLLRKEVVVTKLTTHVYLFLSLVYVRSFDILQESLSGISILTCAIIVASVAINRSMNNKYLLFNTSLKDIKLFLLTIGANLEGNNYGIAKCKFQIHKRYDGIILTVKPLVINECGTDMICKMFKEVRPKRTISWYGNIVLCLAMIVLIVYMLGSRT